MRRKNQLNPPRKFEEEGRVPLRDMAVGSSAQAWFWDREWQRGEREASEQIAAGHTEGHEDVESMFAALVSRG